MKRDTVLKKEFSKKDIQRVRNLVKGKEDEKTQTSVGYSKKYIHRNEGEIWEEDGRKWTIKDGIKQNITKLDKAKKEHIMPLFCPSCHKPMKKRFDKDYYNIHKKCFDCVIEFENELRKIGAYEEYHKNIRNNEIDSFIKDFKVWVEDYVGDSNDSFITEAGDVERWVGGPSKEKILEDLNETINYLESLKKK